MSVAVADMPRWPALKPFRARSRRTPTPRVRCDGRALFAARLLGGRLPGHVLCLPPGERAGQSRALSLSACRRPPVVERLSLTPVAGRVPLAATFVRGGSHGWGACGGRLCAGDQ